MPSTVAVPRIALLAVVLGGAFVVPAQAFPPGAPGTPAATGRSTDSVSWAWTAALDADSYQVFLASSMGSPFLTTSATNFTHAALGPNGLSDFYVRGLNAGEDGPFSGRATAYSSAAVPSGLAVSSVTSVYAVLSWSAAGNPAETFYDLQTSPDGSSFTTYSTYTVTSATASGLAADTSYYFRLRAYNKDAVATSFTGNVSTKTSNAGGTPLPGTPGAPSGVVQSSAEVSWSWGAVSGAAGYRVYLGTKTYEVLATTGAPAFLHAGLRPNETSGITVAAFNATGEGPQSAAAFKTTTAMPPTGTAFTAVSANSVSLSWNANGNPSGTNYEVQQATEGGSFAFQGTYNATSAGVSGLASATTYQFRVRASNQDGVTTAFDSVVSTRTGVPLPGAPGNPATTFISTAEVVWSWTGASNAAGYEVRLATQSGVLLASPAGTAFTHAVGPNAMSSILVRGTNENGAGPFTSTRTAHTLAQPPTALSVSSVTSVFVVLAWGANGNPDGTTYLVEKSTEGGSFEAHSTYTVAGATVAVLVPATTYYFRVLAVNDDMVATAYSGTASTVTALTGGTPPPGTPGAPSPVVLSTAEVSWEWAGAAYASSYEVVLDSKPTEVIATVATTGFIHAGLSVNSLSAIRVRAVNETSVSAMSNPSSAYSFAKVPGTPDFTAVGYDSVGLSWDDAGNPAGTQFEVEGSTEGGAFASLASANVGAASLVGLQGSTTYQFRVRAYNGNSVPTGYSGTASTRTLEPPPPAPGTPTAVVLSTGGITWSWTASTAAASFEVFYASDTAQLLAAPATTSLTLTGFRPNDLSSIVVRGLNAAGAGLLSAAGSAFTFALAPAALTDVSAASTSIGLSWSGSGNAAGTYYELQRSTDGAGFLAYSTYTVTVATVDALAPSTTFQFRVRAANGDGVLTGFSNTLSTGTTPPLPGIPGTPGAAYVSTGVVTWAWTPGTDTLSYELVLSSKTSEVLAAPTVSSATIALGPNEPSAVLVRGVNGTGVGAPSAAAQVYTLAMPPTALAVSNVSASSVSLSWNPSGNPAGTTFQVQLSSAGGPFTVAATVGATFADLGGLSSSTAHTFRVRAINGDGVASAFSANVSTQTVGLPPGLPGTPSAAFLSTGGVVWSWAAALYSVSYEVYLATDTAELLAAPTASSVTLTLGPNMPSAIVVRGVNALGPGPLSAAATVYTLADAPAALSVVEVTANSADLAWDDGGNPPGTAYQLEASTGGPFTSAANTTALGASLSSLSSATAYDFRVRAVNEQGVPGAYSGTASTATNGLGGVPAPGAPGTPAAVLVSSADVSWAWSAAADADRYKVFPASNPSVQLASPTAAAVVFRGMGPNSPSAIVVRGVNAAGNGPLSAAATAYTLARPPASLAVDDVQFSSMVLSWDAVGNPAGTEFQLEVSSDGVGFLQAATTTAAGAPVTGLSTGTVYTFRVRAMNADGAPSVYSSTASAQTLTPTPGLPGTPAAAVLSTAEVSWSWSPAARALAYEVLLATNTAELRASTPSAAVVLGGYAPNTRSAIVVRGTNADGLGPLSAAAAAYTLAMPPAALTGADAASTTLHLVWSAAGNPPGTDYELQVDASGAGFGFLGLYSVAEATVSALAPATTYQFRVQAYNADGVATAFSAVLTTGTAPPFPGVPGTPAASYVSTGAVTWSWSAASDAATYQAYSASDTATLLAAPTVSSFTLTLGPNARSGVVVRGLNPAGTGPLSASATVYALAMPPSALAVTNVTATTADLLWSAAGNAAGTLYHVERSTNGTLFFPAGDTTAAGASVAGLSSSTAYDFRVRAENGDGLFTAYSNTASTATTAAVGPLPGTPGQPFTVFVSTNDLSWTWAGSSAAVSYKVFPASSPTTLLASPATNTFQLPGIGPNVPSVLVVAGVNGDGEGPLSPAATAYTYARDPQSLSLGSVGASSITFSWSAGGNPAGTRYQVQEAPDGVFYLPFSTTTALSFTAVSLTSSTLYTFRVLAVNGDGVESGFSNSVATQTLSPLPGATGVPAVVSVSTNEVVWGWTAAAQASAYRVYLATKTSELLATPAAASYVRTLGPNQVSAVVVRGTNSFGAGPLSAAATTYTLARPPNALALTSVSSSAVALSWSANGNPAGTVYELQLSTDGSLYTSYSTTTAVGAAAPLSAATTYFFQVRARNGDLVDTAFSAPVSTQTLPPLPGTPGTPFTASVSTFGVAWVWAGAANAASYRVTLATKTAEVLASPATNSFFKPLGANEASGVVVQALNATGSGGLSAAATAYSWAKPPASLALTLVSSAAVGLSWSANGNPAGTVYELQLSTDGATYASYSTYTAVGATAPLAASTTYFFQVRARNGDLVDTAFAAAVSTRTLPPLPGTPGTPFTLSVSTGGVAWVWAGASDAASYRVLLATKTAEVLASPATNTYFRVLGPNEASGVVTQGVNATGSGALSAAATTYSWAKAPASLALTAVSSSAVGLSWSANGNPAGTVYELQLSTDGTVYAAYSTYTAVGATAALSASTTYFFQVRAKNGDLVNTAFAAAVSTRTLPPLPGTPGTPFAASVSTGGVAWAWAGAADAASYQAVLATKTAEVLASPATNTFVRTLGPNEASGVAVRGVNVTGAGALSASATAYTWAMPPASLALTAVSSAAVGLSWSANGNPAGTVYELQVSTDGSAYAAYSTYSAVGATPALSASTTYFFQVRARNADLVNTAFSAAVSTRTLPPVPAAPGTPFASSVSTGGVAWVWAGAATATSYEAVLATKTAEVLAAPSTNTFVAALRPNEALGVSVRGLNASGTGPLSASATVYSWAMPPTSLALGSVSSAAVVLSWSANGNPAGTLYELQTSPDGSAYAAFSTYAVTAATPALSASTTYFFRVRAQNGDSVATAFASAVSTLTLPAAPGPPGTPVGTALGVSSIQWTWSAAADAVGYAVFVASSPAVAAAASASASYLEDALGPNVPAGLFVAGVNPSGQGALSAAATVYTWAQPPAALALTQVSSSAVGLSWNANGNPAGTVYELQTSLDGSAYAPFSTYSVTAATPALAASTTYFFRVRAFNGDLVGTDFAPAVSTRTFPPAPGQPGTPSGAALGVSSVSWSWGAAADAAGYAVFAASSPALAVAAPLSAAYLQTGLGPNTAAGLLVAGVNPTAQGPLSAAATVYTLAAPPSGASAAAVHRTSAAVSWSLNGNPAGTPAEVARSTDGAAFAAAVSTPASPLTMTDLLVCTSYWFRVRHLNGDGLPTAYDSASFLTLPSTPSAPGGLAAAALAGNRVSLSWTPSGSESVTEYRLYWDSGTGTVSYAAPLAVVPATMTSHQTGVLASSAAYRFALRAFNRCGLEEANVGVLASAPSLASLTGVKAAPTSPLSGQRVKGDRVTVAAARTLGSAAEVARLLFQYKASSASAWADIPAVGGEANPDTTEPYYVHWNADGLGLAAAQAFDLRAVAYDVSGASDAAPSAVTVSVVPAAAVDYDVAEGLVGGKVVVSQVLDNTVAATVRTGGSVPTRLSIPAGALASGAATVTVSNDPAGLPPPPTGGESAGVAVQIALSGGQTLLANGKTAAVALGYPDADGDGLVDGTTLRADRLVMYSAETLAGPWVRDFASSVDAAERTVTGNTPHFSFFALFAVASASLDAVRVYPVPYMPNGGNADQGVPYAAGNPNSGIVFDNLPNSVSIKVYTVTGQRVAQFGSDASGGKVQWDVKNDRGQDVASGGYIAVITSPDAHPVTKRLLIVR